MLDFSEKAKGRLSLGNVVSAATALRNDAKASSSQASAAITDNPSDRSPPSDTPSQRIASIASIPDGYEQASQAENEPLSDSQSATIERQQDTAGEAGTEHAIIRVPSSAGNSSESDWEDLIVSVMGDGGQKLPERSADNDDESQVVNAEPASHSEETGIDKFFRQDIVGLESALARGAKHQDERSTSHDTVALHDDTSVRDEHSVSKETLQSNASEKHQDPLSLLARFLFLVMYLFKTMRLPVLWRYFGVDSQKVKFLPPILITPVKRMERDAAKTKSSKRVHFKLKKKSKVEQFQPFQKDSTIVQYWMMFMVLPLTFDVFAFGLRLAVCDIYLGKVMVIYHMDVICDVLKLIDIGLALVTAVPKGTYKEQASSAITLPAIAALYFRHESMKAIGPPLLYQFTSWVMMLLPHNDENLQNAKIFNWVWWVAMLPRFFYNFLRLYKYSVDSVVDPKVTRNIKLFQLFRIVIIILACSHQIGCAYYFVARIYDFDDSTWIHAFEEAMPLYRFKESQTSSEYLLLVFKGFCRVASLRYDPGLPGNVPELLLGVAVMFLSVWITSMILGTLLTFLVRRDPMEVAHKERMEALRRYMEQKHVPQDLYETIIRYCQFQYNKNRHSDTFAGASEMFKSLSRSLRIEVANANHRDLVSRCSKIGRPLHKCSNEFLNELVVRLKTVHVMPGDILVHKDEIPRELYFVASGAVQGLPPCFVFACLYVQLRV